MKSTKTEMSLGVRDKKRGQGASTHLQTSSHCQIYVVNNIIDKITETVESIETQCDVERKET